MKTWGMIALLALLVAVAFGSVIISARSKELKTTIGYQGE